MMKVKYFFLLVCLISGITTKAQDVTDSLRIRDSILQRQQMLVRDSLVRDSLKKREERSRIDSMIYANHPYFRFTDPISFPVEERKVQGVESIFYIIIALLLFFALIRNSFGKYLHDLFRTYFQFTVRQRQAKDQLVQNPLPSLLLNIFFVLCGAIFLTMVLRYFNLGRSINFWLMIVYCMIGLIVIYSVKFITLKFLGWIFQLREAAEVYIFIVFTTNKVIGIILLPFIVALAFTQGLVYQIALIGSIVTIAGLFLYRYFLSYASIHRQAKINFFHFLLYLAALEIAPLLLINKLLFRFLAETS